MLSEKGDFFQKKTHSSDGTSDFFTCRHIDIDLKARRQHTIIGNLHEEDTYGRTQLRDTSLRLHTSY